MRKPIIIILSLLALSCMACCTTVEDAYVEADRATYEAIAPEYRRYVEQDTTLADFQKEIRYTTLESWDARVKAEEERE